MDPVGDTAGNLLDEKRQRTTTSIDDAAAAAASSWTFIVPDILGVVLRFLPCLADRATVRSVCRHWRAAACGHILQPPLPLLVLPRHRFFSFSTQGAVIALCRGWMPEEVTTGQVCCVGSSEGWLLMARPSEDGSCHERFLVNAFSHEVVRLPRLLVCYRTSSSEHPACDYPNFPNSLEHVVLSAPPGSAAKCIVAGFSCPMLQDGCGLPWMTLWQPGMKNWYVYQTHSIHSRLDDLVFHEGKLYMLQKSWYAFPSPSLFVFTLGEDEHGVNVSGERRVTMPPISHPEPALWTKCNLVQWRGQLVVIVRYIDTMSQIEKVDVLALDLGINPCGVTKINSFDGDCCFVDKCRCTSFPAGSYEGVQGNCIYFIDKYQKYDGCSYETSYETIVYNMRDGSVKPFTAELLSGNRAVDNLADPVWMFPSQ